VSLLGVECVTVGWMRHVPRGLLRLSKTKWQSAPRGSMALGVNAHYMAQDVGFQSFVVPVVFKFLDQLVIRRTNLVY